MELSGYLSLVRRWWWTLLVAAWVAGLSGYLVGSRITPTYEARAQLLVGPINTDVDTLKASGQLVQTYAKLVTSQPILESVIQELNLPYTPGTLGVNVRATADDVTRFLSITVDDSDPNTAAKIANQLSDEIMQLASRGSSRPEGELQVVDRADPPTSPIAPQVSLLALLAAVAGLLGAVVLILLIEYLAETVRTRDDLSRLTGFQFLAAITGARRGVSAPRLLVTEAQPESPAAASYRQIATKVELSVGRQAMGTLAVLAAAAGDGSGEVAANVAAAYARAGRKVVLVDGDDTSHEVTTLFGLDGAPGLGEWLAERRPTSGPAHHTHRTGYEVVPTGAASVGDTLDGERAAALVARLRRDADIVVVSAAPVHLSAVALVWARLADGTILFAQRDHARRDDVSHASDSLRLVGANVVGVVLGEPERRTGWLPLGRGRWSGRPARPVTSPADAPLTTALAAAQPATTASPAVSTPTAESSITRPSRRTSATVPPAASTSPAAPPESATPEPLLRSRSGGHGRGGEGRRPASSEGRRT